ncbi:hypothetical protein E8E12_011002 [Didymella heteroderae]|uniref:FAD-binding PCMH-type domain-containing protein n=1 Tax=Didymella heteroderae TaxID=1769908 RepID=A0A9P4WXT6_9PLEO|nr:hypothetical protein E8E12_011002 [Didymella heteroderae]
MRTTELILLALSSGCAIVLASDALFEPNDFSVTDALEDIGVSVNKLPAPKPDLAALGERYFSTSCTLAASAEAIKGQRLILIENSTAYGSFTEAYWSGQQGALNPACVFRPTKTLDVSAVVLISRLYQCPFAVKGGGHAAWAGASSIEDGITISLEGFKQAVVSADKQTIDTGPGLKWVDIYTAAEKHGLSVVGGRVASVGVSGLTLGGGISHFTNKHGWACDNVESYELVTASGRAINVTAKSYPDLYWALRGGGNNFGIVTNFKLAAFPLGQMWGGSRYYLEDSFPGVLDAIYNFAVTESAKDLDAAEFVVIAPSPGIGKVMVSTLNYAKPLANASVFNDWNKVTPLNGSDTTGFRTMSGMATHLSEGGPPAGTFETFWGITLKMDRSFLDFIVDTFFAQVATIADVAQVLQIMAIQPITKSAMQAMQKNGGNTLGLDPKTGPYFVLNFNSAWTMAEDEPKFFGVILNVIKAVKAEAQTRGLDNDYIYLNYASEYQDPIGSYGAANKKRLIDISKKYDPAQVFQYLQPGGFKLVQNAPKPGDL